LGWTPQTVMFDAELQDLADALTGYAMRYNPPKQPPSKEFLKTMLETFPDNGGE